MGTAIHAFSKLLELLIRRPPLRAAPSGRPSGGGTALWQQHRTLATNSASTTLRVRLLGPGSPSRPRSPGRCRAPAACVPHCAASPDPPDPRRHWQPLTPVRLVIGPRSAMKAIGRRPGGLGGEPGSVTPEPRDRVDRPPGSAFPTRLLRWKQTAVCGCPVEVERHQLPGVRIPVIDAEDAAVRVDIAAGQEAHIGENADHAFS